MIVVIVVCVFLLQFPLPAEPDHSTMLNKVKDFSYVVPKTLSSALNLLLTEVCKCHPLHSNVSTVIRLNCLSDFIFLYWCSFCARIRRTGFVTWSVSRCRPSFVALHLTLSSFKSRLSTLSLSSGLIPTGQPKQGEAFHWITLITLTVIKSFILFNCLLLWPTWTWAQPHSRLVKHKTGLCDCLNTEAEWRWEALHIMDFCLSCVTS